LDQAAHKRLLSAKTPFLSSGAETSGQSSIPQFNSSDLRALLRSLFSANFIFMEGSYPMSNSRRDFLKTGAMAALFLGTPVSQLAKGQRRLGSQARVGDRFQIPGQSEYDPLFNLRRSSFAPYINSSFVVRSSTSKLAKAASLTLVSVSGLSASSKASKMSQQAVEGAGMDSFSLLFRSSARSGLAQDVYDVHHEALGNMRLLLVPVVSKEKTGFFYEAVINRSQG
jgi:hypothetical protein